MLLHGYAQTSHMWLPIVGDLIKNHTVIIPDLRGVGQFLVEQAKLIANHVDGKIIKEPDTG